MLLTATYSFSIELYIPGKAGLVPLILTYDFLKPRTVQSLCVLSLENISIEAGAGIQAAKGFPGKVIWAGEFGWCSEANLLIRREGYVKVKTSHLLRSQ